MFRATDSLANRNNTSQKQYFTEMFPKLPLFLFTALTATLYTRAHVECPSEACPSEALKASCIWQNHIMHRSMDRIENSTNLMAEADRQKTTCFHKDVNYWKEQDLVDLRNHEDSVCAKRREELNALQGANGIRKENLDLARDMCDQKESFCSVVDQAEISLLEEKISFLNNLLQFNSDLQFKSTLRNIEVDKKQFDQRECLKIMSRRECSPKNNHYKKWHR